MRLYFSMPWGFTDDNLDTCQNGLLRCFEASSGKVNANVKSRVDNDDPQEKGAVHVTGQTECVLKCVHVWFCLSSDFDCSVAMNIKPEK